MQTLEVTALIERMAGAAAVRWYGHVLQREEDSIEDSKH